VLSTPKMDAGKMKPWVKKGEEATLQAEGRQASIES
jgi:hypothetical protein